MNGRICGIYWRACARWISCILIMMIGDYNVIEVEGEKKSGRFLVIRKSVTFDLLSRK